MLLGTRWEVLSSYLISWSFLPAFLLIRPRVLPAYLVPRSELPFVPGWELLSPVVRLPAFLELWTGTLVASPALPDRMRALLEHRHGRVACLPVLTSPEPAG
jgi:hypothetical protein